MAEVTTAPSGVQDLEELDKYKLERHPGKDTPAVTDEYPVLLSLYTDGANMCKTVMRGVLHFGEIIISYNCKQVYAVYTLAQQISRFHL